MSSRNDDTPMSVTKIAFVIMGCLALGSLVVVGFNMLVTPAAMVNTAVNSANNVVSKTLDADNVITKYEWFHDANGVFQTRVQQIANLKQAVHDEADPHEHTRLGVELRGVQNSCLKIVNEYNANASKTNVSIFQGRNVPPTLDPAKCN